ncbi:hypothetical protein [Spongiactinospora gelatinilytica]|uniref:hypothetical protein n=1 Tax=Spongiactinospora gelatinilytica TaxID=2666298 RepID=UPI001314AAAC|nr:hypothetical protein [Spongiactinospora gelatinilytica]
MSPWSAPGRILIVWLGFPAARSVAAKIRELSAAGMLRSCSPHSASTGRVDHAA